MLQNFLLAHNPGAGSMAPHCCYSPSPALPPSNSTPESRCHDPPVATPSVASDVVGLGSMVPCGDLKQKSIPECNAWWEAGLGYIGLGASNRTETTSKEKNSKDCWTAALDSLGTWHMCTFVIYAECNCQFHTEMSNCIAYEMSIFPPKVCESSFD